MKKLIVFSVAFLFMASFAFAVSENGPSVSGGSIILDTGGPDDYGYSWEDNDNGGTPVFNWIDITSIGTEVTGLADDNNVGPFQMGFDFPYYWYDVNRMWIGSNGYISFSSSANFAHPFAGVPTSANPNDLVAILTGDLDFTQGADPKCYYYTNNVDTFIVSYHNVVEFGQPSSSNHTFQAIFTAADSSVTFQYGPNQGTFLDSNMENRDVIGIENANGQVGLEYIHDNLPADHMWHDGLVIVFHPDPDPSFEAHDFGVVDGFQEGSGGLFHPNNTPLTVKAIVKNFGNQPEDSLRVRCQIRLGFTTLYDEDYWVSHLEPGEEVTVEYSETFTPVDEGTYRATFSAIMSGDQNSNNNSKTTELVSYVLPTELSFNDGIGETGRSWNGDYSGFGMEFQVPEPINVTSTSFNVFAVTTPGPAYLWVLPDDGTGNPDEGNSLGGDTLTVNADGWVSVDLSSLNLSFEADEKFWVVVLHAFQSTFTFGMDQGIPLSYRGWEYTGGLAGDRDRELNEVMINIQAESSVSGVGDDNVPTAFTVAQNYPNPFNAKTNINFSLENASDVTIDIFNLVGQKVADFSGRYQAGENTINWDASNVSSGVYFYKVSIGSESETRKMVLLK